MIFGADFVGVWAPSSSFTSAWPWWAFQFPGGIDPVSAKSALENYSRREAKKLAPKPNRGPNKKPEFEFKKALRKHLENRGFLVEIVESKAVYSEEAGRYVSGQARAGFSDTTGVTPYFGVSFWAELKAPGRRGALKVHQRDFLLEKINWGAFAVCVDSVALFDELYDEWVSLRREGYFQASKEMLTGRLPKIKENEDSFSALCATDRP